MNFGRYARYVDEFYVSCLISCTLTTGKFNQIKTSVAGNYNWWLIEKKIMNAFYRSQTHRLQILTSYRSWIIQFRVCEFAIVDSLLEIEKNR